MPLHGSVKWLSGLLLARHEGESSANADLSPVFTEPDVGGRRSGAGRHRRSSLASGVAVAAPALNPIGLDARRAGILSRHCAADNFVVGLSRHGRLHARIPPAELARTGGSAMAAPTARLGKSLIGAEVASRWCCWSPLGLLLKTFW